MQITRRADASIYDPPLHSGVQAYRLQGAGDSPFCTVGLSYYEPCGSAQMSASSAEKIYVMIEGELTVALLDGRSEVLGPFDSCLIEAGETREVVNRTTSRAVLLVISPP